MTDHLKAENEALRHPARVAGAIEVRIGLLFDAAMQDSTPAIHDHKQRLDELMLELYDAITRRELEMSLAAKCEEVGRAEKV